MDNDLVLELFKRDHYGCVAPAIDDDISSDDCRDRFGDPALDNRGRYRAAALTLDHIQEGYGRMGKRAKDSLATLVVVCWYHHLGGWSTGHRPMIREYIHRASAGS